MKTLSAKNFHPLLIDFEWLLRKLEGIPMVHFLLSQSKELKLSLEFMIILRGFLKSIKEPGSRYFFVFFPKMR